MAGGKKKEGKKGGKKDAVFLESRRKLNKKDEGKKVEMKVKLPKKKQQQKFDAWAADARNPKTTVGLNQDVLMTDANPSIAYEVPVSTNTIEAPALAAVTYAIQRGWTATTPDPQYPYQAWMYMRQQLINYATTGKVDTMYVPYWFAYIGQALMEKKVKVGSGYANYKFTLDRGDISVDSPAIVAMGALIPNGLARHWNIGVIQNEDEGIPLVNKLFPTIDVLSHTYTPADGQKAWTSLIEFLQNVHPVGDPRRKMHKLISSTLRLPSANDASAYAILQACPGGGYGVGCAFGNVTSESKILCPLLSRFRTSIGAAYSDPVRAANFFNTASLDTLGMTGIFLHLATPKQLRTRHAPIAKFIDVGRFFDVLCCWTRLICEEMLRDPANVTVALGDVAATKDVLCPLTIQELYIIFRAQIMAEFKDTQFFTQGTYTNPLTSTSSQANVQTPFVDGQGTCARAGVTKMRIPLFFAENIRSSTYRVNFPDGTWTGGAPGKGKFIPDLNNPQYIIPVLGCYYKDEFDPFDYQVEFYDNTGALRKTQLFATYEDIYPLEKVPAGSSPFIAKRGSLKVNAEAQISIIDGSTTESYVAITDPAALNKLISAWNTWVSGKATYSVPLTEIGTDGGINSLEVITMTDHFIEQPTLPDASKKVKDTRFDRFASVESSHGPYKERGIVCTTSQNGFDSAMWETIQQFFIKPSNQNVASVVSDPRTYNLYQRWQAANRETFAIITTDTNVAPTMSTAHYQFALFNTRQRGQLPTEALNFVEQEASKGRGGILSSLAGSLFGDTAGKVVGMLPFLP